MELHMRAVYQSAASISFPEPTSFIVRAFVFILLINVEPSSSRRYNTHAAHFFNGNHGDVNGNHGDLNGNHGDYANMDTANSAIYRRDYVPSNALNGRTFWRNFYGRQNDERNDYVIDTIFRKKRTLNSEAEDHTITPNTKRQEIFEEYDDEGIRESVSTVNDETGEAKSAIIYVGDSPKDEERTPARGSISSSELSNLEHVKGVQDADKDVDDMVNSILNADTKLAGTSINVDGVATHGNPVDFTKGKLADKQSSDFDVDIDGKEAGENETTLQQDLMPQLWNEAKLDNAKTVNSTDHEPAELDKGSGESLSSMLSSERIVALLREYASKANKTNLNDTSVMTNNNGTQKSSAKTADKTNVTNSSNVETVNGSSGSVIPLTHYETLKSNHDDSGSYHDNTYSNATGNQGNISVNQDINSNQDSIKGYQESIYGNQDNIKSNQDTTNGSQGNTNGSQENINGSQDNINGSQENINSSQGNTNGNQDNIDGSQDNINGNQDNIIGSQDNVKSNHSISGSQDSNNGNQDNTNGKQDNIDGKQDNIDVNQESINGSHDNANEVTAGFSGDYSGISGSSGKVITTDHNNVNVNSSNNMMDNSSRFSSEGNNKYNYYSTDKNTSDELDKNNSNELDSSNELNRNNSNDFNGNESKNELGRNNSNGLQGQSNDGSNLVSSGHGNITSDVINIVDGNIIEDNTTNGYNNKDETGRSASTQKSENKANGSTAGSSKNKQDELKQMPSNFLTTHPSSFQILMEYFQNESALQNQLQSKLKAIGSGDGSVQATKKTLGGGESRSVAALDMKQKKPQAVKEFVTKLLKLIVLTKLRLLKLGKLKGYDKAKEDGGEKRGLLRNIARGNVRTQSPVHGGLTRKTNVEINANFNDMAEILRKINMTEIFQGNDAAKGFMDSAAMQILGNPTSNAMETGSNAMETGSNAIETGSNAMQTGSNAMETGSNAKQTGSNATQAKSNVIQSADNSPIYAKTTVKTAGQEQEEQTDALMYKKRLKSLEISLSQDYLSTWMYHYRSFEEMSIKPSKLRSGISTLGSSERLSRVIRKAVRGDTVNIMVVGGSISAGGGLERDRNDVHGVYYKAFMDWWRTSVSDITDSKMKLNVVAIGGTDSEYYAYCIKNYIHDEPDLVLWELAANDYRRYVGRDIDPAKPLEQLTRVLLTLPSHPALIFVNFFRGDYYKTTKGQDCPDSEDEGGDVIAEYYKITSLSWRNVICSEMREAKRKKREAAELTLKSLFSTDGYHPSLLGHAQTATLLISYIRGIFEEVVSQERKRIDNGGLVNDEKSPKDEEIALPNPIYNDPKNPDPLCWTLLTSDYNYKVDNHMPEMRITEANGFEFVNVTHWPIRHDRLRCLKAVQPNAKLRIKFNVPERAEHVGNDERRELAVVTHNSYLGMAKVWLDENEAESKVIEEPKGQRRTQVYIISKHVKAGVHSATFQGVGVGFCLSALAVL